MVWLFFSGGGIELGDVLLRKTPGSEKWGLCKMPVRTFIENIGTFPEAVKQAVPLFPEADKVLVEIYRTKTNVSISKGEPVETTVNTIGKAVLEVM